MTQKTSDIYSNFFHDDESVFHHQLNKSAKNLRESAHNMAEFINKSTNQTEALNALKQAYLQIESMPAENLCNGIENIKSNLLKVEFLSKESTIANKDQEYFIKFLELQNIFNEEVNAFVKKVIQLEMFS